MAEESKVSNSDSSRMSLIHLIFEGSYTSTTTVKSSEKPPAPRNETNLCGLQNQGATWWDHLPFIRHALRISVLLVISTRWFRRCSSHQSFVVGDETRDLRYQLQEWTRNESSHLEPLFHLTPKDLNLPANYNDQSQTASSGSTLKVNFCHCSLVETLIFSHNNRCGRSSSNCNVCSLKCFCSIKKLVRRFDWRTASAGNPMKCVLFPFEVDSLWSRNLFSRLLIIKMCTNWIVCCSMPSRNLSKEQNSPIWSVRATKDQLSTILNASNAKTSSNAR